MADEIEDTINYLQTCIEEFRESQHVTVKTSGNEDSLVCSVVTHTHTQTQPHTVATQKYTRTQVFITSRGSRKVHLATR